MSLDNFYFSTNSLIDVVRNLIAGKRYTFFIPSLLSFSFPFFHFLSFFKPQELRRKIFKPFLIFMGNYVYFCNFIFHINK